ncbi:CorA family divalent cation transporter [Brucella sp. NM4]|uniref:CorA family divalent cation transporter n=1 Tax=Brucella sp. NM4 TaxID=3045175 RepID=UPI0024BD2CBF|nr:CorA family divalent cation transporter [Brucella sp. NM4]WHS33416.1 CorA family divalent cation transporter [Brucella sp. NM4]
MNIIHGSLKEHSTGLVGAYHKRPDHAVVELKADEVDAALAANDGWVWLHVDLVDQRSQGWLSERCALPASARAILEGHDDSLVLSHEAGTIHGVIADMHQDMERMSTTIGRLHFAVMGGLLVTGRRHPLEAVDRVRHSFASGFCPATAYELFEAVVTAFCKNYRNQAQ